MQELSRSQRARAAIREFKTITDAMAIRGFYRPSGKFGKTLSGCLRELSPEIYGTMNDIRVVELKGLEYVIDRLPPGIEEATKIILTDEDQFEGTPFKEIMPLKRRRTSYRISAKEFCFIISRGTSEIYDIITHMTFLNVEAGKLFNRLQDDNGDPRMEFQELEKVVKSEVPLSETELDSALWNLSIILGRPYHETRDSYEYFEKNRKEKGSNNGIFSIIYHLAKRIESEHRSMDNALVIYLTPSLMKIIGHQRYGRVWASDIKEKLMALKLETRPLHIVSANLHSVLNVIYGFAAVGRKVREMDEKDLYPFFIHLKDKGDEIANYAANHGWYRLQDRSGTNIDCQIIDTAKLESTVFHPGIPFDADRIAREQPVILVMDYAFGAQAFEVMEQLLKPIATEGGKIPLNIGSISVMGKAGILTGEKGDIMLATAHVCEGTSDNYLFDNDLGVGDFDPDVNVFSGPMATVLGTSLQNRDVLEMFQSDWQAVGLEMEGGYYQKAINASIIKGNIPRETKVRYAYYASDNPLKTGNTLAAGAMGVEGVKPTYMITKVILEKILGKPQDKKSCTPS
ncbi:MAG: hypothetical protein V1793_03150 [Pseudomonadota bacterium]